MRSSEVTKAYEEGLQSTYLNEGNTYLLDHDIIPNLDGYISFYLEKDPIAINTMMWKNAIVKGKHVQIFPGIDQLSNDFLAKKIVSNRFYMDLFKGIEDNVDLSGRYQALASYQHPAKIIAAPLLDVTPFRDSKSLRGLSNFEKHYYKRYVRSFFRYGKFKNVYVNGKSSTGAPLFIYNKSYKTFLGKEAIKNLHVIANLWWNGDYDELLRSYYILPIMVGGVRIQPDKVKYDEQTDTFSVKKRETPDLQWLRSQGKEGSMLDMRSDAIYVEGFRDALQGSRVRRMFPPNSQMGHLLAPLHNFLYQGYCRVAKIAEYNGPKSVLLRANRKLKTSFKRAREAGLKIFSMINSLGEPTFISLDKGSFDTTLSYERLQIDCEVVIENTSAELSSLFLMSFATPTLVKEFFTGQNDFILTKELLPGRINVSTHRFRNSLTSGHPFVSLMGKDNGSDDIGIYILDFLFYLWKECKEEELILFITNMPREEFENIQNDFTLYCKIRDRILFDELNLISVFTFGDDSMVFFAVSKLAEYFKQFISNGLKRIHDDALEEQPIFLGYNYTIDGYRKSIGRLIESLNGSERGWDKKTNPEMGLFARYEEYRDCNNPYLEQVWHHEVRAYRDLGFDLERYKKDGEIKTSLLKNGLNYETAEYLRNPESMHYKIDPEKIDKKILEVDAGNIDAEFQYNHFKNHIDLRGRDPEDVIIK